MNQISKYSLAEKTKWNQYFWYYSILETIIQPTKEQIEFRLKLIFPFDEYYTGFNNDQSPDRIYKESMFIDEFDLDLFTGTKFTGTKFKDHWTKRTNSDNLGFNNTQRNLNETHKSIQ